MLAETSERHKEYEKKEWSLAFSKTKYRWEAVKAWVDENLPESWVRNDRQRLRKQIDNHRRAFQSDLLMVLNDDVDCCQRLTRVPQVMAKHGAIAPFCNLMSRFTAKSMSSQRVFCISFDSSKQDIRNIATVGA